MMVVDCRILYNRKIAKDTYKISLQWENMPKTDFNISSDEKRRNSTRV